MIILQSTTDAIKIKLGGAVTTNALDCVSAYRETSTTAITANMTATTVNSTSQVDVVPAPSAGFQRICDYISVFNRDTNSDTVIITLTKSGVDYLLFRGAIAPGEKIEYQEGSGFRVLDVNGAAKVAQALNTVVSSSSEWSIVTLGADVPNNNAIANTLADVTGMTFPVTAGKKYEFEFRIPYEAAATTTGARFVIDAISGAVGRFFGITTLTSNATATSDYSITAANVPAVAATSSSNTTSNFAVVKGMFFCTNTGALQLRFSSEVAASLVNVLAGTVCVYREI